MLTQIRVHGPSEGRACFFVISARRLNRSLYRLTRGPDGSFDDGALADVLQTATETPAGAFRAQGCAPVFRAIEILSIEASRRAGVCTMNEFRKSLGLEPFIDFEYWNSDPEVDVSRIHAVSSHSTALTHL